jgi:hypothetical protein
MEELMRFRQGVVMATVAIFGGICAQAADWKWAEYGLPPSNLRTCTPETRGENDSWWLPYFRNKLKQPRNELLFIGDSITDRSGWTESC